MVTALANFIFDLRVPLLSFQYLNKRTILEGKISGAFTSYLGLHIGKISLKSVISIEHVVCSLGRPYRAMAPRYSLHFLGTISRTEIIPRFPGFFSSSGKSFHQMNIISFPQFPEELRLGSF